MVKAEEAAVMPFLSKAAVIAPILNAPKVCALSTNVNVAWL